jgi:DNA-binding MarR family transcriptional regulator
MSATQSETMIAFLQQMTKVTSVLRAFMRQKFKEHHIDITFEMLQVLRFLWEKDGVNQQEIADATIKDKASLTYLIDNLVRRNLVQRTEDSHDRRNKIITLTPQGQELKILIKPWLEEMYQIGGQNIPVSQMESGLNLFKAIHQNFQGKGK